MPKNKNNIRVFARFRPPNSRDNKLSAASRASAIDLDPENSSLSIKGSGAKFQYDTVFSPETDQAVLNERVGKPCVQMVLEGYNSTIFAYGQTGSGKTFTMYGNDKLCWQNWEFEGESTPDSHGLVPRVTSHLFDQIATFGSTAVEYIIKCSFVEIYNEQINDLFNPASKPLRVRETARKGVWVEGITEAFATCKQDVADMVRMGFGMRSVSATAMNERSSRSHCVFILNLHQTMPDGSSKVSRLNLVDLAGSERIRRSGVEGRALKEAQNINQSLSTLGSCIHALTEKGRKHIPYRDSTLTHMLKESLGGNTKTFLVITATLAKIDIEETISTLRFGARAKSVRNCARINVQKSNAELETQLQALRKYVAVLEAENARLKSDQRQSVTPDSNGTGAASSTDADADTGDSDDRGLVNPRFVQLELESERLRQQVDDVTSQVVVLKSTVAVLLTRLAASGSENKDLRRENESLSMLLRIARLKETSPSPDTPPTDTTQRAVAAAKAESTRRALQRREEALKEREDALDAATAGLKQENARLAKALQQQCAKDIALRRREAALQVRIADFEEEMRNFQAQSKTDSPRVLVSAPSGHGTSGHAPAAANTAAPEPTPGVTRLVARSMQHVQQHVGPGARTQFQQLWKQAAQKVEGSSSATRGIAMLTEGIRMRRLRLQQEMSAARKSRTRGGARAKRGTATRTETRQRSTRLGTERTNVLLTVGSRIVRPVGSLSPRVTPRESAS